MIIFLTILVILLLSAVGVMGYFSYVLNQKFNTLQSAVNLPLKTLDDQLKVVYERVDKIDDRIVIITGWCETLRANQDTLQDDIKKIFHEFLNLKKESGQRPRLPDPKA